MSDLDPHPQLVEDGGEVAERAVDEAIAGRRAPLGPTTEVIRYLPTRQRSTVGAWCFLDHYGPDDVAGRPGMVVGPHPHIGLQTVTWLFEGRVRHLDSLGHDQLIEPGQLNLMTAGRGIAHAEISPDPHPSRLHGVQLWVALPEGRRATEPGFAHHGDLPVRDLGGATATVLVGELAGRSSPAVVHSPLLGAEVAVSSSAPVELPLEADFEHAVLVVDGRIVVDGRDLGVGDCRYLGRARRWLSLAGSPTGRLLLLGGEPFGRPLFMWWNFVGGNGDEIVAAREDWEAGRRFGPVSTEVGRVPAPPLPPGRLRARGGDG